MNCEHRGIPLTDGKKEGEYICPHLMHYEDRHPYMLMFLVIIGAIHPGEGSNSLIATMSFWRSLVYFYLKKKLSVPFRGQSLTEEDSLLFRKTRICGKTSHLSSLILSRGIICPYPESVILSTRQSLPVVLKK